MPGYPERHPHRSRHRHVPRLPRAGHKPGDLARREKSIHHALTVRSLLALDRGPPVPPIGDGDLALGRVAPRTAAVALDPWPAGLRVLLQPVPLSSRAPAIPVLRLAVDAPADVRRTSSREVVDVDHRRPTRPTRIHLRSRHREMRPERAEKGGGLRVWARRRHQPIELRIGELRRAPLPRRQELSAVRLLVGSRALLQSRVRPPLALPSPGGHQPVIPSAVTV